MLSTLPADIIQHAILPFLLPRDIGYLIPMDKAMHRIVTSSSYFKLVREIHLAIPKMNPLDLFSLRQIRRNSPSCWRYICLFNQLPSMLAHEQAIREGLVHSAADHKKEVQWLTMHPRRVPRYLMTVSNGQCRIFKTALRVSGKTKAGSPPTIVDPVVIYQFHIKLNTNDLVYHPLFWIMLADRPMPTLTWWKAKFWLMRQRLTLIQVANGRRWIGHENRDLWYTAITHIKTN